MVDMVMFLGGRTVPKPSTFKLVNDSGATDVLTLAGVLYTDFRDRRRSWTVGWKNVLYQTDVQTIVEIWEEQFTNNAYPILDFPAEGVYAPVKMEISDLNIKYNGVLAENFSVTLIEQNPVS
jgi:hypothetical protein